MNRIRVDLDSTLGQFVVQARANRSTTALTYDEAIQLYSRLGELIERYEDNEDKLGSLDSNTIKNRKQNGSD